MKAAAKECNEKGAQSFKKFKNLKIYMTKSCLYPFQILIQWINYKYFWYESYHFYYSFDRRGKATAFDFPLANAFFELTLIHQCGMLQLNESMMT